MQEKGRLDYKDVPYGAEVQSFIAEPLLPEDMSVPDEPGNVREIAYRSVLRMILTERNNDRHDARHEPGYSPRSWADAWELSPEQHLGIKLQYADELSMLSTHIAMANNVLRYRGQESDLSDNPVRRKFQRAVTERLENYVEYPGKNRAPIEDKELFSAIKGDSLAVVAPPGAGKTRLQAQFLQAIGVGEPLYGQTTERRRALVVLPSQFMVDQYNGTIGENEFRSILGKDVSTGAIWEHSKATDADVTFVIASSVPQLLEKGYLNFDNYCATIVDEGHFVLDGSLLESLQAAGAKMLFFTATPAKDELRDLRRYFQYVEEGNLREFIEGEILNRARLFSYFANKGREADMAAELAVQLVNMGRKVAVFCQRRQQGDDFAQTKYIVDYVNQHAQKTGSTDIANILGTENGRAKNEQVMRHYLNGDVRCIATVQMLGEGHNDPELDAVILIGPFAEYEAIQKAGRCLRKGTNESLIIEILNDPSAYSLWQAFGFDSIVHGAGIGYRDNELSLQMGDAKVRPDILSSIVPSTFLTKGSKAPEDYVALNTPKGSGRHQLKIPKGSAKRQPMHALNSYGTGRGANDPDPRLNRLLSVSSEFGVAAGVEPVRTASFFQRDRLQARQRFLKHATPAEELATQYQVPRFWMQYTLDDAQVPYEVEWLDANSGYTRHYAQKANDVLSNHDMVAHQSGSYYLRKAVLQLYGLHPSYLDQAEARIGIKGGRYSLAHLHELEQTFADVPVATSEYISLPSLRREFRAAEKKEFFVSHYLEQHPEEPVVFMRRKDASGPGIPVQHISTTQADAIHDAYEDVDVATDDHISVTQIALLADVSIATVTKQVDRNFRGDKKILRSPSHRKRGTYLSLEHGHQIIEKLQTETLPPTHLPLIFAMTRLAVTKKMPATYIKRYPERIRKVSLRAPYNEVVCLEWSLLRELERRYALRDGAEPLDFKLLESGTPAGKEYARRVQLQFLDASQLEPEDVTWVPMTAAMQELQVTSAAFALLLAIVDRQPKRFVDSKAGTIHTDLLQKAQRHATDPPPVGWYSHSQIVDLLAKKDQAFPRGYTYERTDRRLCRNPETGVMDIYYTPQAYRGIVHYCRLRTSEEGLTTQSLNMDV